MPSTNGFTGNHTRLEARVQWLIRRYEALDARLLALELATAVAKRPAARASVADAGIQRSRTPPRARRTRRR
jgi:hypothetical protein